MNVVLQYFDSNGHNFGVITPLPNLEIVEHVFLTLSGQEEKELDALAAYGKSRSVPLRSTTISAWLRAIYHPGRKF